MTMSKRGKPAIRVPTHSVRLDETPITTLQLALRHSVNDLEVDVVEASSMLSVCLCQMDKRGCISGSPCDQISFSFVPLTSQEAGRTMMATPVRGFTVTLVSGLNGLLVEGISHLRTVVDQANRPQLFDQGYKFPLQSH